MNITGSTGKNLVPDGPFTVGKKGELLFEGKAPKEVREISSESKGNRLHFVSSRNEYMQSLAGELNNLYKASANTILDAKISFKGLTTRVRVTVANHTAESPRSDKENITSEMLEHAKRGYALRGSTLIPKDIVPRNDGSFEIIFEAKMHPGREIRQSFSADEIQELAKMWEKQSPK